MSGGPHGLGLDTSWSTNGYRNNAFSEGAGSLVSRYLKTRKTKLIDGHLTSSSLYLVHDFRYVAQWRKSNKQQRNLINIWSTAY